jgi:mRNA interferase RelE/StbE
MTFINTLTDYSIVLTKSAQKDFQKLPSTIALVVEKKLSQLTQKMHDLNILKLVGYPMPTYRLRVGDYRIIFEVREREIIVLVIGIKHRKDAY